MNYIIWGVVFVFNIVALVVFVGTIVSELDSGNLGTVRKVFFALSVMAGIALIGSFAILGVTWAILNFAKLLNL